MFSKKRSIAPRTSRNVNKHFADKRLTMRAPATGNQVKGSILSVDELIYWFQKFHYAFYTHVFNVLLADGTYNEFYDLDSLAAYLKSDIAVKSGKNKGQLPVSIVRAIYNSGAVDPGKPLEKQDVARDVWICCHGAEDYLPEPSVDKNGNFVKGSEGHGTDKQIRKG